MESDQLAGKLSFGQRLSLAFKTFFDSAFAERVQLALRSLETAEAVNKAQAEAKAKAAASKSAPVVVAPERVHASGLLVLAALQREGRLIDFLQQDVAGFSDDEVGAAARVVHAGCARVLKQYFAVEPAIRAEEGAPYTVAPGFDAQRVRLTGNVTGQPPFKGTVKHHGWITKEVRLPSVSESLDPRVLAPAEVELT